MSKTSAQLDREIAESYLGMYVTARSSGIQSLSRRVRGVAREVDTSSHGLVMLWLELPDGRREHVFLEDVAPEVPQATVRPRRSHR